MPNKTKVSCPKCRQDAKRSSTYPDLYVCDCSGVLEDVSVLACVVSSDLVLVKLNTVDEVMAVGLELRNAAGNRDFASDCLADGDLYKVSKGQDLLYLIWVKPNKLILSGSYFGKRMNARPDAHDRDNFKIITKEMIDKNLLDKDIFESADDDYARFYLAK
jgi:hypothetical protein